MTDNLSVIILRKEDFPEFWSVMSSYWISPQFLTSNRLEFIYHAQISPEMKTYLTLKFPNMVIKPANFNAGKI